MQDNEAEIRRMSQRMAVAASLARLMQTTAEQLREAAECFDKSDVAELASSERFYDTLDAIGKLTRAVATFEGELERLVKKAKQELSQQPE
jgi:hypothetical protein